jgi:hypothetical protein
VEEEQEEQQEEPELVWLDHEELPPASPPQLQPILRNYPLRSGHRTAEEDPSIWVEPARFTPHPDRAIRELEETEPDELESWPPLCRLCCSVTAHWYAKCGCLVLCQGCCQRMCQDAHRLDETDPRDHHLICHFCRRGTPYYRSLEGDNYLLAIPPFTPQSAEELF